MTEGGDIGFQLYYKNSNGVVELVPSSRIESHLVMEEGEIVCDQVGKCKLFIVLISNIQYPPEPIRTRPLFPVFNMGS